MRGFQKYGAIFLKSLSQGFQQVPNPEIFVARIPVGPKVWNRWRKDSSRSKILKYLTQGLNKLWTGPKFWNLWPQGFGQVQKFWNLWRKGLDRSKILKSLLQGFQQVQNPEIFDARVWACSKSWKYVSPIFVGQIPEWPHNFGTPFSGYLGGLKLRSWGTGGGRGLKIAKQRLQASPKSQI